MARKTIRFKEGDIVHGWGISVPEEWAKAGRVRAVHDADDGGQWVVWENGFVSVTCRAELLILASEAEHGFERIV